MLLVEIIILGFSRANNIKEIQTTIKDYGKNLKEDNLILNAINSGKNSYYIVLPDMINNKVVASYFADLRSVGETPTSDENTTANEEIKKQETEITQSEENLEQNRLDFSAGAVSVFGGSGLFFGRKRRGRQYRRFRGTADAERDAPDDGNRRYRNAYRGTYPRGFDGDGNVVFGRCEHGFGGGRRFDRSEDGQCGDHRYGRHGERLLPGYRRRTGRDRHGRRDESGRIYLLRRL